MLQINTALRVVIVILVLAVLISLSFTAVAEPAKKESIRVAISRLCPDWVANGCTSDKADDLSTDFEGIKSLKDLCMKDFTGSYDYDDNDWIKPSGGYDHCKRQCMGCPL